MRGEINRRVSDYDQIEICTNYDWKTLRTKVIRTKGTMENNSYSVYARWGFLANVIPNVGYLLVGF